MNRRAVGIALCAGVGLVLAGCSPPLDTTYGRVRGASVNGTGALAELFRARGHEVRAAVGVTPELKEWADVIVRFAPYPGPPESKEAEWLGDWLDSTDDRRLIYVPRDYDAQADYWAAVLAGLPKNVDPKLKTKAETRRDAARNWFQALPERPKEVADARRWFGVEPAKQPPKVCAKLGGPWADGIDPKAAALPSHDILKVDAETVHLTGDGAALAMVWTLDNGSEVLVIANGSFLLNAALANPARRPLAVRVVNSAGFDPLRVAFLQGHFLAGESGQRTIWDLFRRLPPFRWVVIQMALLGLIACLARAHRLGRPRPEPPSGADRPAAHPEALGALLKRAGQAEQARAVLDAYRKWRFPSGWHSPGTRPPSTDQNAQTIKTESPEI